MKQDDIKGKTQDELVKMLNDLRREQLNLRFQKSGGQVENTARVRTVRRSIARVKTFLNQKKTDAVAKATSPKTTTGKTTAKRGKKAA